MNEDGRERGEHLTCACCSCGYRDCRCGETDIRAEQPEPVPAVDPSGLTAADRAWIDGQMALTTDSR